MVVSMTDFLHHDVAHLDEPAQHFAHPDHGSPALHETYNPDEHVYVNPYIHEQDINHDGRIDVITNDTDHDGKDDAWEYDLNGDGKIDMVGYDTDHDGSIDIKDYDHNEDGLIDEVKMDADHDGRPELVQTDTNHDGTLDHMDRDSNGDGQMDQHDTINSRQTMPHWGPDSMYGSA
jgi:hypothetical protein